ncbi:acyl-[acyl-carrier-protein] thioesterase [[Clostridium] hylemonae]|uniref:acyl-[acyl-carrier-protein] thioesterase n=1 Tax=[Clostridium] hylemonae TaxID=89153 RepID=UPI001FCA76A8|nr:acyl-ACP thioesterase domain-containing protein [[Clostridium] hylemonae]BDF03308.1 hypothetical protein CE91St63_03700 [[Clostridium] hylemonae]
MYSFDSRVRFSEVDHTKQITLPGIINYFQDCSTFHSESLGLGVDYFAENGRAWVLNAWQVIAKRYPKLGEEITVSTWATEFNGLYGLRNFRMTDGDGRTAAYANSVWVYMDMVKGRPVRPLPEEIEAYGAEEPLDMEYAPRKISLPENWEEKEAFQVRKYHIDTNEHVNNCQYVQMALEALEEELCVRQVRVEYRKSAVCKDIIRPRVAREDGRIVVSLTDAQGKPYAVVELEENIG